MKVTNAKLRILLIASLVGLYLVISAFSTRKMKDLECVKTTIDIRQFENNYLLTREDIQSILLKQIPGQHPYYRKTFNIQLLEDLIENNKMVDQAEIFFTLSGELYVSIQPKIPLMRILNGNTSYYVDKNGEPFPLSPHYTPVVPILTGKINDQNIKNIIAILDNWKVHRNPDGFFSGFYINPQDKISAYTFETKEIIQIGKAENIEEKLLRLKAFYQYLYPGISHKNITKINLNFEKQVICEYEQ